jgi:hypothetical protein
MLILLMYVNTTNRQLEVKNVENKKLNVVESQLLLIL